MGYGVGVGVRSGGGSVRAGGSAVADVGLRAGLAGAGARKNGWQLAKYAGHRTPDGFQVERAIFQWITWYNEERLHSAFD